MLTVVQICFYYICKVRRRGSMDNSSFEVESNFEISSATEICDNYEHVEPEIEYVLENVLFVGDEHDKEFSHLQSLYNSVLLNPCYCSANDNCDNCTHGGNYELADGGNELVLKNIEKTTQTADLLYECSGECRCIFEKCQNRLVQYGPRQHLKVIDSKIFKSKGLISVVDVPCGGFICEYAGELLTRSEARRRYEQNAETGNNNYILWLNEYPSDIDSSSQSSNSEHITIVDPSRKGNIGRYLNHSCDPNCVVYSVRIDCPIPKIGIFAKRHVKAGEELCFHYGGGAGKIRKQNLTNKKQYTPCLCNTENCEKYLPYSDF